MTTSHYAWQKMLLCLIVVFATYSFVHTSPTITAVLQKIETVWMDKSLLDINLAVKSVNKTQKGVFGSVTFLVPAIRDVTYIHAKLYKQIRKEYRALPLDYKIVLSDALDKYNVFGMQDVLKHHITPPVSWPLKTGVVYHVNDIPTRFENIPPVVPAGDYIASIEYYLDEKRKMAHLNFFTKTF